MFQGKSVANPHASRNAGAVGEGPRNPEFPFGRCQVPLCWQYLGGADEIDVVAGSVRVSQDQETLAVRPASGWAVCERLSENDSANGDKSQGPSQQRHSRSL